MRAFEYPRDFRIDLLSVIRAEVYIYVFIYQSNANIKFSKITFFSRGKLSAIAECLCV